MFVKTKEELLEYIKGLTDGFRGEEPEPVHRVGHQRPAERQQEPYKPVSQ